MNVPEATPPVALPLSLTKHIFMKLHLPKGLRTALLACFAAFAGVGTTITTATITGGVFAVSIAGQAMAEDKTITESMEINADNVGDYRDGSVDDAHNLSITGEGTVVKVTVGGSSGFVDGNVTVGSKATLQLSVTDALGYSGDVWGGDYTNSLLLEDSATLYVDGVTTLSTAINLSGNNTIAYTENAASDARLDGFGGKITATGTNNIISSGIGFRQAFEIEVTNAADTLVLAGRLTNSASTDYAQSFTKSGAGKLIFDSTTTGKTQDLAYGMTVSAGEVVNNTALSIGGTLTIAAGSTFTLGADVELTGLVFSDGSLPGGLVNEGTLAFTNGATLTLSQDVIEAILDNGGSLGAYTGTVQLAGLEGKQSYTTDNGVITLYSGISELIWNGGDGTWSTGGTGWNTGSVTDGSQVFSDTDSVTFNTTANVTLGTDISASKMTVAQGATVTLSGAYGLSVKDLVVDGTLSQTEGTFSLGDGGTIMVAEGQSFSFMVPAGTAQNSDNSQKYGYWDTSAAVWRILSSGKDADGNISKGTVILNGSSGYDAGAGSSREVFGNYLVTGSFHSSNGGQSFNMTIGAGSGLRVLGNAEFENSQYIAVSGEGSVFSVGGTLILGHNSGGDAYPAHLEIGSGAVVTLGNIQFRNSSDNTYVKLDGGRLNLGSGAFTYKAEDAKHLKLISGTLGTTADTLSCNHALSLDGALTIDTTKQNYDATTGLTTAGTTGATVSLGGVVTGAAGSQLTLTGLGTLEIAADGTLALTQAIQVGAGTAFTMQAGATLDLSNWTALTDAEGNISYSILAAAEDGANVDLSSLTGIKVTGVETHGGSWKFNTDGTISLLAADGVTWTKGDLVWKDGAAFDNGTAYKDGVVVMFTGDAAVEGADAATVTLEGNVAPAGLEVTSDAVVSISNAESATYSIKTTYLDNAGELTLNAATEVGTLTNEGTLKATAGLTVTESLTNTGSLTSDSGDFNMTGDLTNEGTLTTGGAIAAGSLSNTNTLTAGGAITVDSLSNTNALTAGGAITVSGAATNSGTLTANGGISITGAFTNTGTLEIGANSSVGSYTTDSTGTILVKDGQSLTIGSTEGYYYKNDANGNLLKLLTWADASQEGYDGSVVLNGNVACTGPLGDSPVVKGNYVVNGELSINAWSDRKFTVDSVGSLTVNGTLEMLSQQSLTVNGDVKADTILIGHSSTAGDYRGSLYLNEGGSIEAGIINLQHVNDNDSVVSTFEMTGGTLKLTDSIVVGDPQSVVKLTAGTLQGTWKTDAAVTVGSVTVDEGAAVTLNGAVTTTDTSSLKIADNGALTLAGTGAVSFAGGLETGAGSSLSVAGALTLGGSVKLGSAIETLAGGSLDLADGTVLDLSGLTAVGTTYTLLTGAGNLDLSSLADRELQIIGSEGEGQLTWTFNTDGTISYTSAAMVTWSGGNMTWTAASTFDGGAAYDADSYITFAGGEAPAAVVTLGENISTGTVVVAVGADVTMLSAEGDTVNKLTATKGLKVGGTLTIQDDVLSADTKVTSTGDAASFVIDGVAVDYTGQLENYNGGVTVQGAEGQLSLSAARDFASLTVKDGATLNLTTKDATHNDAKTISLSGGSVVMNENRLNGTLQLGAADSSNSLSAVGGAAVYANISGEGNMQLGKDGGSEFTYYGAMDFSGKLTFAGTQNLNIGVSYWGSAASIRNLGDVVIDGATVSVDTNSGQATVSTIANTGNIEIKSGSLTLNERAAIDLSGADAGKGVLLLTGGTMTVKNSDSAFTLKGLTVGDGVLNLGRAIGGGADFALNITGNGTINIAATDLANWTPITPIDTTANGLRSASYALVTGLSGASTLSEGASVQVDGVTALLKLNDAGDAIVFDLFDGVYYVTTGVVDYADVAAEAGATSVALNGGTLALEATDVVALPLNVVENSQLSLAANTTLSATGVSIAEGKTLSLDGAGTYTVTAASQLTGLSAAGAGWAGTLVLDGSNGVIENGYDLSVLGNAASTVAFQGAKGYIVAQGATQTTYAANIVLTNTATASALELVNGYTGADTCFTGTVSGSGDIVRTAAAGGAHQFTFAGDVSGWTGSFKLSGESGDTTVVFNKDASVINANLANDSTSGVLSVAVHNDAAVTVAGVISGTNTHVNYSGTGTKTVSGENSYAGSTVIQAGTVIATNNKALGSSTISVWNGSTLQLESAVTELAGTVAVEDGAELYLNGSKLTGTTSISNYGTVRMGDGASIAGLTSGKLVVDTDAKAASTADMMLLSLNNAGTLDLGDNNLELSSATTAGGNVIANTVSTVGASTFGTLSAKTLQLGGTLTATELGSDLTRIELSQPLSAAAGTPAVLDVGSYAGESLTFALTSDLLPAAVLNANDAPTYTLLLEADSALAANLKLYLDVTVVDEVQGKALSESFQDGVTLYTLIAQGNTIVLEAKFNGTVWNPAGNSGVWSQDSSDEFGGDATTSMPVDANIAFSGDGTDATGAGTVTVSGLVQSASITVDADGKSYTFTGDDAGDIIDTNSLALVAGNVTLQGVAVGSADDGDDTTTEAGPLSSVEIGSATKAATLTVGEGASLYTEALTVNSANGLTIAQGAQVDVSGALVFADKTETFTNAGELSMGADSDLGTVENTGAITVTGSGASIDELTAGGKLELTEGAGLTVDTISAASIASVKLDNGATLEITDSSTTPLVIESLEGKDEVETFIPGENGMPDMGMIKPSSRIESARALELASKTTMGGYVKTPSLSLQAGAAGSTFSEVDSSVLTLVVHDGQSNILSSTSPLLTANTLTALESGPIALTLTGLDATTVGDFGYGDSGSTDYIILSTGSAIALSDFTVTGTDGVLFEDLLQDFALAENKAYATLDVRSIDGGATYQLVLSVTKDDPRAWDSSNPDWAGNEDNNNANPGTNLSGNVLDLTQIPGTYHDLDTVDVAYITNSAVIDLTNETREETDTDGLLINHLTGTGDLEKDKDNSLTLKGDKDDLATLSNMTDKESGLGSSSFGGKLIIDGMQVKVEGDGNTSLSVGTTELTGADAVLSVGDKADYRTDILTNTEAGMGTIAGTVTVTGATGGKYDGKYGSNAGVTLAANAVQQLTIGGESNSENLALSAGAGSELTLVYTEGGATVKSLNTQGASVILDNAGVNTLKVDEPSMMVGGDLGFTVDAAGISKGNAVTVTEGLNIIGTTLWVSQEGGVRSASFDVTKGTKGLTLFTLTDGVASDVTVRLDETDPFFERYFKNVRVENGVVKADLITDHYSRRLALTENGTTGMKMLDLAALQLNPQDGDLGKVMQALDEFMAGRGDAAEADKLAAAVSGAGVASLGLAISGDVERQLKAIRNRTTTMGVDPAVVNEEMPYFNAWINAEGDYRSLDNDRTLAGYTLNSWGGTVGFDMDVNPSLTWGLALTAMYGDFESNAADMVEGDVQNYYVSAFARAMSGAWVHTFVGTLGMNWSDISRTVSHSAGSYTAEGDTTGMSLGFLYEVGRTFALNEEASVCWQPVFNVSYRHIEVDGYSESGSDAALNVGDQSLDTVTFGLGARLQAVVGESIYNRTSIFEGRALIKFDAGDRSSEMDTALLNAPVARGTVKSAELDAFGLELGAGLTVPVGFDAGSIFVDGSLEFRGTYTNFNATMGYRVNF